MNNWTLRASLQLGYHSIEYVSMLLINVGCWQILFNFLFRKKDNTNVDSVKIIVAAIVSLKRTQRPSDIL